MFYNKNKPYLEVKVPEGERKIDCIDNARRGGAYVTLVSPGGRSAPFSLKNRPDITRVKIKHGCEVEVHDLFREDGDYKTKRYDYPDEELENTAIPLIARCVKIVSGREAVVATQDGAVFA